jgi:hypothetical protein
MDESLSSFAFNFNLRPYNKDKWSYTVALLRWSISAQILDQELFLTSVLDIVEKAPESFGVVRFPSVVGMLLPILVVLVPFATTTHRLTWRLADVCTTILQQNSAGPAQKETLDAHSTAAVFNILQGLLCASPDAFVVSKFELPSLDDLSKYPGVVLSESFVSSVQHVQRRIDSLKAIAASSVISQRILEIVLLLDRMLGAASPGRGVIENKHSTDVESPPSPPRKCMSIHTEGKSCSYIGSSACTNDPPPWSFAG